MAVPLSSANYSLISPKLKTQKRAANFKSSPFLDEAYRCQEPQSAALFLINEFSR